MFNYQKNDYRKFAQEHFEKHGLDRLGWTFGFDKAKSRLGVCRITRKEITVSENFCDITLREEIQDTILHEIAHALAGAGKGHGIEWKKWAIIVGAKPTRCYEGEARVPHTWETKCVECGRITAKTHKRRSQRVLSNRHCPCGGVLKQERVKKINPELKYA